MLSEHGYGDFGFAMDNITNQYIAFNVTFMQNTYAAIFDLVKYVEIQRHYLI